MVRRLGSSPFPSHLANMPYSRLPCPLNALPRDLLLDYDSSVTRYSQGDVNAIAKSFVEFYYSTFDSDRASLGALYVCRPCSTAECRFASRDKC